MRAAPASHSSTTQARMADHRVLVVPGLHGSGPAHWQSRWERLYPGLERVQQDHWDQPDLPAWSQRLGQVLARSPQSVVLVAHSFGCLASVHRAALLAPDGAPIVAALLVAPADPGKFEVSAAVRYRLPFPALVVGSRDDPWMSLPQARQWADQWGAGFIDAGARGHINAESGLGHWREGQQLLLGLIAQLK